MTTETGHKNVYRWRCRRGMKEVEVVLIDYLERYYDQDNHERQQLFGRLLECQDVDMFEWFTYRARPEDPVMDAYVSSILKRLAAR